MEVKEESLFRSLFRERFKELIKEGETQEDFAKRIGLSRPTVALYISGKRIPDSETLFSICQTCSCSADWLIGLSGVRTPSADLQAICDYTGLSEESIENITFLRETNIIDALLSLLESSKFLAAVWYVKRLLEWVSSSDHSVPVSVSDYLIHKLGWTYDLDNHKDMFGRLSHAGEVELQNGIDKRFIETSIDEFFTDVYAISAQEQYRLVIDELIEKAIKKKPKSGSEE